MSRIEQLGNDVTHRVQVIDAQYGGLLTDTASVLVVTRSLSQRGGGIVEDGHTFDVRLRLAGGRWQVTAIHPSHPGPPARRLTAAARHTTACSRRCSRSPVAGRSG